MSGVGGQIGEIDVLFGWMRERNRLTENYSLSHTVRKPLIEYSMPLSVTLQNGYTCSLQHRRPPSLVDASGHAD